MRRASPRTPRCSTTAASRRRSSTPRSGSCPTRRRTPNHPLKPRHLAARPVPGSTTGAGTDPVTGPPAGARQRRRPDLLRRRGRTRRRSTATPSATSASTSSPARRTVETVFGALDVRTGDYVLIPRATDAPLAARRRPEPLRALRDRGATATSRPPKRYLSRFGQLLEHAPYCERDLHGPAEPLLADGHRRRGARQAPRHGPAGIVGTPADLRDHPFDVVGWDGCLYPYTFNVDDFEPITGRVHQPPPVHQVFEGNNFVVCNFVPAQGRLPPAVDPGAVLPLQRRHRRGDVLRRRRLRGPQGLGHRPRLDLAAPGRARARPAAGRDRGVASGADYFDELAVMVDTFRPLELGEGGMAGEDRRTPGPGPSATDPAPPPS